MSDENAEEILQNSKMITEEISEKISQILF